jgi:hypothetical protein
VKLATFRSSGRDKIALVHSHDSRLFDLAAAADRDGNGNPAFASMLSLIDAGPWPSIRPELSMTATARTRLCR